MSSKPLLLVLVIAFVLGGTWISTQNLGNFQGFAQKSFSTYYESAAVWSDTSKTTSMMAPNETLNGGSTTITSEAGDASPSSSANHSIVSTPAAATILTEKHENNQSKPLAPITIGPNTTTTTKTTATTPMLKANETQSSAHTPIPLEAGNASSLVSRANASIPAVLPTAQLTQNQSTTPTPIIVGSIPTTTTKTSNTHNISYQIVKKDVIDHSEVWSSCPSGKYANRFGRHEQRRKSLFNELAKLVDFSTRLSLGTSLKMLILGDSVAMQIFHMLDMAMGGITANRTVLETAFADHISYGLSSTGHLGAMRTTGMLLRENENQPLPNQPGGGWNQTMIRALLDTPGIGGKPTGAFDVMLFRMPHGWLQLEEITDSAIKESLELASSLLGVKRVILLTLPFSNNVFEPIRMEWLQRNKEIRELVNTFEPNKTFEGIERLVLMDIAQLTDEIIKMNVRHLGYFNDTESDAMPYMSVRLKDYLKKASPAAAHVCAGPMFKRQTRILCDKNAITPDGMHFCGHTYGGRIVAATGCLLQCLYDTTGKSTSTCQKECNDNFMTLKPVRIN